MEAEALSGLGTVHQQMGQYTTALRYHQQDLEMAEELGLPALQSRACGNLGAVHEALGNFEQAVRYQEQHLSIAASTNDQLAKTLAYSSLGRVHQLLGNKTQAIAYLTQGLCIAEALGRRDEEARIRNRLGLALWSDGDLEGAQKQLEVATHLLETIRREARNSPDYKLSLFELQTSSYQVLQRVLVGLNRQEEALVMAERGRNRAFVDLLLERFDYPKRRQWDEISPTNLNQIKEIVNRQRASVLYYSIAAGFLYVWLIVPTKGVVKFHAASLMNDETIEDDPIPSGTGLLERLVTAVRDSLGIESNTIAEEEAPSGFLRMVNRHNLMNSSNYSLSSLFSLGSVGGSVASLQGSTRSSTQGSTRTPKRLQTWKGPSCLHALYTLLLQPFEEYFAHNKNTPKRELILVLEGDLYLVPFPLLRSSNEHSEYLCERFSLHVVPNLSSLRMKLRRNNEEAMRSLVVGNPKLPQTVTEQFGWKDVPQAEQEAGMVADLLQTQALVAQQATKDSVLAQIQEAECVHIATHVSWKLSALVFSPTEMLEQKRFADEEECEHSEVSISTELPPLSEFLLSAADIASLRLTARLVVISSSHTKENWATSDGLVALVRALLAAGAQAVLISLWPVPDTATKILLRAFYSALLQGTRAARALAEAMQTVQHTKHFAHPANWAGFLLIGCNVRLSNKVALMGQALCELLRTPEKCRDALRVTLHLVEKSLQRIHRGQKNAMYTTQKSIENKVGVVTGWKELLMSVGFRFEPASNGIPSSVFFPQSDPDERLTQCSASLQALLGLTPTSIHALSKLTTNPEVADDIIAVIQSALSQFSVKGSGNEPEGGVEIVLNVRLWRIPGCHELLASLGFDLTEVGQDKVTLRTSKQANRRNVQFTLQALLALFDTQEAPKSLSIDSSSSLESLCDGNDFSSSHSDNEATPVTTVAPSAFTSYVRRRGEPDGSTTVVQQQRKPLARPGGGESDAAFTPSPPVLQNDSIALSLAHQTRIRNLYTTTTTTTTTQDGNNKIRPDSSSSASSDWDNGHATVLRRQQQQQQQQQPPMPPPRTNKPLVDLPVIPLYNNLPPGVFENSSDSEMEAKLFNARSKISMQHRKSRMSTLDRLSVRTEITPLIPQQQQQQQQRKLDTIANEDNNERLLYFGPNVVEKTKSDVNEETSSTTAVAAAATATTVTEKTSNKVFEQKTASLHDTILATQLRHINRELTPTISEVYHERNIGLGLAPPLSKLLLNQNNQITQQTDNSSVLDRITLEILEETELANQNQKCQRCKLENTVCACKNAALKVTKPWMSTGDATPLQQIQSSDLTTADILEREVKNKKSLRTNDGNNSSEAIGGGFHERRDEGDGRSIADSSSSSYKGVQQFRFDKMLLQGNSISRIKAQIRNKQN